MKRLITLLCAVLILIPMIGCESKAKEVENMEITISFPEWVNLDTEIIERTGLYTGTILNDLPNGKGKFETTNADGDPWYYEGEFTDGLFNGKGKSYWPKTGYTEVGNFVNGLFTPTKSQLFQSFCTGGIATCELPTESISLIDENENLFPCTTAEDESVALSLTDTELSYKKFIKNPIKHVQKLHQVESATASLIFEDFYEGHTLTTIIAVDQNSNRYVIYYDGSIEVYDDDAISFYGLPVADSHYKKVSGGTTNVIVVIGSIVELA